MKKRFLSILLTLTMLLSLFPGMAVTVSAADGTPGGRGCASVEISILGLILTTRPPLALSSVQPSFPS